MSETVHAPISIPVPVDPNADRPVGPALLKGWRRKCPACGEASLFDGYLAVHHECPNCNEALHHQRADDGPAWATLVVTGHLLAPLMLLMWDLWQPSPIVMASTLSVFLVAVSLFLLPRFKGAFIGLQWSRRMHGFGAEADAPTHQ